MTPAGIAALATRTFCDDLRERGGFKQLIESIGDWKEIQQAMQNKVERALIAASPPPKETQGEILDFT